MPPACQGDESLDGHFDHLLTNQTEAEIGLLVGRNACANKDLVLLLIATPPQERSPITLQSIKSKSNKKGKQPQAEQASLDTSSITDHAAQVAAMMPGGLAVVGVYLYGPESIFTSTTQQLCKVLEGLRSTPGTDADKMLFVSSSARRYLCKHWPAGAASTAALPVCTFQLAPTLTNMHCITCRYALNIKWPTTSSQTAAEQLEAAAAAECQRIQQGTCLVQGRLESTSATMADLAPDLELELLCAPSGCSMSEQHLRKEESVIGRIVVKGVLHGRAVVNKKDTLAAAADFIKGDLVSSLQARLDILLAEAEETSQCEDGNIQPSWLALPSGLPVSALQLPQRVFLPVKGLSLSDYLAAGELMSDAAARAGMVLGPSFADHAEAECPEGKQSNMGQKQQLGSWDPCQQQVQITLSGKPVWTSQCHTIVVATSTLVALIAAVGVLYVGQ